MKILIISEFFSPINKVASIRTTKFAKMLHNHSNELYVVCRNYEQFQVDPILNKDVSNLTNIYRVSEGLPFALINRFRNYFSLKRNSRKANLPIIIKKTDSSNKNFKPRNSFTNLIRWVIDASSQTSYVRQAKKILKILPSVDVVISSHGPKTSSILGCWYKKKKPSVFWIADHRDPVYNLYTLPLFKKHDMEFVRKICKNADILTAVSKGCLDALSFDEHPNAMVLTNGFDRDDLTSIEYSVPKKFTFAYLGYLYSNKRDLTPLFKIIKELIVEKLMNESDICIKYAGDSVLDFKKQAAKYELTNIIEAHGFIPRSESLKMQLESHVLILATWNSIGAEGITTGKFLEYMMIKRPIIALISGNLQNSNVKNMICEGGLGFSYEEANHEKDEVLLKEYVLKQYLLFKQNSSLEFTPNIDYIEKFNYENIVKQLISIFP